LAGELARWREEFKERLPRCPAKIIRYAAQVATTLGESGIRVSPRRVRMISRSLLAACVVGGSDDEKVYLQVLQASLPHRAAGEAPFPDAVYAAHRMAWNLVTEDRKQFWLVDFHNQKTLAGRVRLLHESCPDPDTGSAAVAEFVARVGKADQARCRAFALALYPAAAEGRFPKLGAEGIADLGRVAAEVLQVNKIKHVQPKITQELLMGQGSIVLAKLTPARRDRARQLFASLMVDELLPPDPADLEQEFDDCVREVAAILAGGA